MLSFLSRRNLLLIRKTIAYQSCFKARPSPGSGCQILLSRYMSSHSQEQLYIPFATDVDREHASIMFWVSKNTNLKEVNVNIRVVLQFWSLFLRERTYRFGVFPLIAMCTLTTTQHSPIILMKMFQNERNVKSTVARITTINLYLFGWVYYTSWMR